MGDGPRGPCLLNRATDMSRLESFQRITAAQRRIRGKNQGVDDAKSTMCAC